MTMRMKRQSDSVLLLSILYLASTLATVQAVEYFGKTEPILEGQPWRINCTGVKANELAWRKNGHEIAELKTGDIAVEPLNKDGVSALYSLSAKEEHTGKYECAKGGKPFLLVVKSAIKYKVLLNESLPMTLECENRADNEKVIWLYENQSVTDVWKGKNRPVEVNEENGTLKISSMQNTTGTYVCNVTGNANASTTFEIVEKPFPPKLPVSVTVVEGEKLTVTCTSERHGKGLKVQWLFANRTYTADEGRVKLTPHGDVNSGTLSVENITKEDRGPLACYVGYDLTQLNNPDVASNDTTLLRVKDKLAALWPFLGICAEVFVLCAIILIYEKKRNKSELEESDTDQSPDTKPTPNKDSDVRQRK